MPQINSIPGNPIYNETETWKMWSIHEIFLGGDGTNKYIPKVNDYVVAPETGELYIVKSLHPITYVPEIVPIIFTTSFNIENIINDNITNFRIYYDRSVTPYTLSVDSLFKVYSRTANTAVIYRGYLIEDQFIISRRYDNSGNYLGHELPLDMVAFNSHDNYAVKTVPTCNTNAELTSGEVVTVVIYDTTGKVLSKRMMLVEDTTFIRQAYAEQKYITQISLKSAFISNADDTTIEYPVNLPIESLDAVGVVHYNDGSKLEYPIDNDKFRLYGLDQFVSTIVGHRVPLVLSYKMGSDESAIATITTDNTYVTRNYELIVSEPNLSYNVKLFIYPEYVDSTYGYQIRAFLMNMDRNVFFDVSNKIRLAYSSVPFNPKAYGVTQRLTYQLELSTVSPIFRYFMHVQTIDINLRAPATERTVSNIWEVNNQAPSSKPNFGGGLFAYLMPNSLNKINIKNGYSDQQAWLKKFYYDTQPLAHPLIETEAPKPTHMTISYENNSIEIPISDYDKDISIPNANLVEGRNITILYTRKIANSVLKLSVAQLTIRRA